jgi:hypothetical protein
MLNQLSTMPKRHMREWRYSSTILDLGIRWRWVVSFMPWLFNPWKSCPPYPLDRWMGGSQSSYGRCGDEKSLASATLGSHSEGVFRQHMQWSLVWPWWAHPMAREFPGLDASRLFHVGVRQVTCVWTKTTQWSWPPTDHHDLGTDHSGNAACHVVQLVRVVWTVLRLPWRSCWVLTY